MLGKTKAMKVIIIRFYGWMTLRTNYSTILKKLQHNICTLTQLKPKKLYYDNLKITFWYITEALVFIFLLFCSL